MRVIYKYGINAPGLTELTLPAGAKPLAVGLQNGKPVVWVDIDIDQPEVEYELHTFGTGQSLPTDTVNYVGTLVQDWLVWHVYYQLADLNTKGE